MFLIYLYGSINCVVLLLTLLFSKCDVQSFLFENRFTDCLSRKAFFRTSIAIQVEIFTNFRFVCF